ncbi:MAG: HAD family hydrolase [Chloroflexi bacterium]|nr:HAD family hydrolase [Chloroflexota bacterium]
MMEANGRPRGLLLDLGHTLVRWEVEEAVLREAYREAHDLLVVAEGQPIPPDDAVWRLVQRVLAQIRASAERGELDEQDHYRLWTQALAAEGYGLPGERVRQLVEREHRAFVRHLRVSEATHGALAALRRAGYRLGLVSNVTVPGPLMRATVAELGLAPYLDLLVFSSEVGVRKPHPRIYERALAALELAPGEAVFVGDRVREDILGPQALGLRAVLCREHRQEPLGAARPDAVIERFAELPELLASW